MPWQCAGVLSRSVGLRGFESHPPHQERYPVQNGRVLGYAFFLKKEKAPKEYDYFESKALRGLSRRVDLPDLVAKKLEFPWGSSNTRPFGFAFSVQSSE